MIERSFEKNKNKIQWKPTEIQWKWSEKPKFLSWNWSEEKITGVSTTGPWYLATLNGASDKLVISARWGVTRFHGQPTLFNGDARHLFPGLISTDSERTYSFDSRLSSSITALLLCPEAVPPDLFNKNWMKNDKYQFVPWYNLKSTIDSIYENIPTILSMKIEIDLIEEN